MGYRQYVSLLLFVLVFLLSGCSVVVRDEQAMGDSTVAVEPGHGIGQTFVAEFDGLSAVDVQLVTENLSQKVYVSLKASPDSDQNITTSEVALSDSEESYTRLSFPLQSDSGQRYYYLDLAVTGSSSLAFATSAGNTYINGALYTDNLPQDAQLKFRLVYDPYVAGLGLMKEFLGWLGFLVLAVFAFVLPGWAILSLVLGDTWRAYGFAEKLTLSGGVSLALYPVLMLLFDVVHLPLGLFFAWLPALLSVAYLLLKNLGSASILQKRSAVFSIRFPAEDVVFFILVGFIFFIRLWVIRGIEVPLWGDSYQHTMIAQLIFDNGGLFDSWQPYEPYESLTVQYGFSAGVAVWMWLTGQPSPLATTVFGQLLNGFAILSVYPLTLRVSKGSRWAGNASLVIAGLISTMPAFYVNWGRYAQLSGQAILPVALCLLWVFLEGQKARVGSVILNAVLVIGLLLSYYRMAFYYVLFVPVLFVLLYISQPKGQKVQFFKSSFLKLSVMALLCLVLVSPWIIRVTGSSLSEKVEAGVTDQVNKERYLDDYTAWKDVFDFLPEALVVLMVTSLLISLFKRNWAVLGVLVWTVLVSAVRAGAVLNVPGANLMQSFAVLISLYIPSGIITGVLFGWAVEWLVRVNGRLANALGVIIIVSMALVGLRIQRNIADPNHFAMVTQPDLKAMEWIQENTAANARFLVEGFRIYNGTSAVGSDAGWWIPLLAGRKNTMPPQYALLNEKPSLENYSTKVVNLVASLESSLPTDQQVRSALCDLGVTHIYIGQFQGQASLDKIQLFSPSQIEASSSVQWVYKQDRVRIYTLPSGICD